MSKFRQNVYISNIELDEAREKYYSKLGDLLTGSEEISVSESAGRYTFDCVYAEISSPYFNSAAMDGIAVNSEATYNATESDPRILIENKDFEYINTGNALKKKHNAVIMIENVIEAGEGKVRIIAPAYPWQHVRLVGEDIAVGEMILPSRHRIRPIDLGALISAGINKIKVHKKPKVGIIPTGSELVDDPGKLGEGKILESNSYVFEGLVNEYGGTAKRYSPCRDDMGSLREAVLKGVEENDILLVNAGSSAGRKDYTVSVLRELGEVIVHGLAIKPGKPTILAVIDKKPVIGIPGYPVSSFLVFELFARPLILQSLPSREHGHENLKRPEDTVKAVLSRRIVSSFKSSEMVRVTVGHIGGRFIATPLMRGAGATMSLVRADGILEIPRNAEGMEAGEEAIIHLYKPAERLKRTLLSIGSHDMIMDEVSDMMELASAHTGSMGGITALRRNECHLAPVHLLDEETGEYNIPYIKRFFPGRRMALIKGLRRTQGLMVQKGNPSDITDFGSLIRKGIHFVNRQKGSGTRILLDYSLKKLGIDAKDITGYEKEMTTHMAVAAAIKADSADAGLGVLSAARALDLDFIPVGHEEYDFLTAFEYLEDERLKVFISVVRSGEFKERVMKIGGYEMINTGEIVIIGE